MLKKYQLYIDKQLTIRYTKPIEQKSKKNYLHGGYENG